MLKIVLVLAATLFGLVSHAGMAQTVDDIIGKHIQAMGGADKLANLKSVKMSSSMQMMGMDIPQTTTIVHQKALRQDITAQSMTITQVIADGKGWGINPIMGQTDPTPTPDDQIKLMADQLDLTGSLFNYKEKGSTAELIGKETVGTTDTYKLKVTKSNGAVEQINLDAQTYLPVKTVTTTTIQGQDVNQEVMSSDYQQVEGVAFPFRLMVKSSAIPGGLSVPVKVTKVEVNQPIDESIFKMPVKK